MVREVMRDVELLKKEIRALKGRVDAGMTGTSTNPGGIVGIIGWLNGGTGVAGSPFGVSLWKNQSGASRSQGVVVVENGDQTFGVTTTVGDPLVIGVLDDNAVLVGSFGRVRHMGYQSVVNVQGNVTIGHYLRTSTTAGRAEDAGTIMTSGCFAIALTAYGGGGAGTVAAHCLPHPIAARLSLLGDGDITTPDLFLSGAGGLGYAAGQVRMYGPSNAYIGHWGDSELSLSSGTSFPNLQITPTSLTIAAGAITMTRSHHQVDTELAAATDDLDTINGGNAGRLLVIRPVDSARTVVIKHNTGNILCAGGLDITLNDAEDWAWLLYDGVAAKWYATGGAVATVASRVYVPLGIDLAGSVVAP